MKMVTDLDAGPVYLQRKTQIGPGEIACDLLERLSVMGAETLLEVIRRWK